MRTCKPWCTNHLYDDDTCTAPSVDLDFGNRGDDLFAVNSLTFELTADGDDASILVFLNGMPIAQLNPEQAEAAGWGLLAQTATARRETHMARRHLDAALHHADQAAQAVTR